MTDRQVGWLDPESGCLYEDGGLDPNEVAVYVLDPSPSVEGKAKLGETRPSGLDNESLDDMRDRWYEAGVQAERARRHNTPFWKMAYETERLRVKALAAKMRAEAEQRRAGKKSGFSIAYVLDEWADVLEPPDVVAQPPEVLCVTCGHSGIYHEGRWGPCEGIRDCGCEWFVRPPEPTGETDA